MPANTPSPDWSEVISPDEAHRHEEFAAYLGRNQLSLNRKFGKGRGLHRKQVLGLRATVTVPAAVPAFAAHGLFSTPGQYPAFVRLSNGSPSVAHNSVPDVRGFAISVREVSGPAALGAQTDRQDFLLINRDAFGVATSKEFAEFVKAAQGRRPSDLTVVARQFVSLRGASKFAKLIRDTLAPFAGFAASTFYSAVPIQVGPYAARVRLVPADRGKSISERIGLGGDLAATLLEQPLSYNLFLDFFVDEETTPIEDATNAWPLAKCPSAKVATLELACQDPNSVAGAELAADIEADEFDPWHALRDHRPLGEVMRARKVAYYTSQQNRK